MHRWILGLSLLCLMAPLVGCQSGPRCRSFAPLAKVRGMFGSARCGCESGTCGGCETGACSSGGCSDGACASGNCRPGGALAGVGIPGGINYRPQEQPAGPPVGTYAYPYYTLRGPRDFLQNNPPSIGP